MVKIRLPPKQEPVKWLYSGKGFKIFKQGRSFFSVDGRDLRSISQERVKELKKNKEIKKLKMLRRKRK